jgi:hypothetical protein
VQCTGGSERKHYPPRVFFVASLCVHQSLWTEPGNRPAAAGLSEKHHAAEEHSHG